jgi:hypothetical protein
MYRRTILNLTICPGTAGPASSRGRLLAAVGCVLALVLSACGGSSGPSGAQAREPSPASGVPGAGAAYTLMQMNLCLSGQAGCYGKVAYPAGVEEAVARIRAARPNAVTVNEACRGDVARIARQTGYHLRFSRVFYLGRPLPCVRPGGRGLFGVAVLTEAAIRRTDSHDFEGQSGPERRRWLCVATGAGVDVCTAHLNTRSTGRGGRQRRAVRRARGAARASRGRAGGHLRR